jgi:elongation factor P hydroxylase
MLTYADVCHYEPDDVDKNNENLEKVQVKPQMYDVC